MLPHSTYVLPACDELEEESRHDEVVATRRSHYMVVGVYQTSFGHKGQLIIISSGVNPGPPT